MFLKHAIAASMLGPLSDMPGSCGPFGLRSKDSKTDASGEKGFPNSLQSSKVIKRLYSTQ